MRARGSYLEALHQVRARVAVAQHEAAEVAQLIHPTRIRQQRRQLRAGACALSLPSMQAALNA